MAAAAGTWAFSLPAVERMKQLLLEGGLATDCLQEAMADIENDEKTGRFVIGRGGYPNKQGIIQCDAAIMEGQPGRFGAVAALHGIGTPLAVARKVMEETPHSFLAGDGAVAFAEDQGFTVEDNQSMMSKQSTEAYQEYLEKGKSLKKHDTLGLIALDTFGNITAGVSTSGAPFKYPGRVGDSPMPGCGLYADKEVGAAVGSSRVYPAGSLIGLPRIHTLWKHLPLVLMPEMKKHKEGHIMGLWGINVIILCNLHFRKQYVNRNSAIIQNLYFSEFCGAVLQPTTGDGDKIMCFCPCFHAALLMKQGLSPMDACQTVVQDILQRTGKENMFELGIIAMNMKGEVGAASSMPFPYCIWSQGKDSVEQLMQQC